jgi:hypothetical protein
MSEGERCPKCGVSYERVIHHIIDGVPCYDLRVQSLESALAAAQLENAALRKTLAQSAALNCAIVGQNSKLIARNLALGDTPPASLIAPAGKETT